MMNLVVISFFPAFSPASSGGELRLGNLYRCLSQYHNITLVSSTNFNARVEEIQHTPNFREFRFPKDQLWYDAFRTLEGQRISGELSGLAFALAVSDPACELRLCARDLASHADFVIHEFPYSEPIFSDGVATNEVYNSHNFELGLIAPIIRGEGFDRAYRKVWQLEKNLVRRSKQVFATSVADADKFRLFYGIDASKLAVCPNGFDDSAIRRTSENVENSSKVPRRPRLLFVGSEHYPNVDAARFLIGLARQLPNYDFVIAGGVSNALGNERASENIELLGPFSLETKLKLLSNSDVFLNPVVFGSGTSLKAIEALASGLVMVTTPEGIRGLDVVDGVHAVVAARSEFAQELERLISSSTRRQKLASAGAAYVRSRYTWEKIASELARRIGTQQSRKPKKSRPFVLALNDYPINAQNQGGAVRIQGLLAHLDSDVLLISFGSAAEFTLMTPRLLQVTVPKTQLHQAFETMINSGEQVSFNDGVAGIFVQENDLIIELIGELSNRAHLVVFEHCYMAPALDVIRMTRADIPIVYSAHNVEASLKREALREHRFGSTLAAFVKELEERLIGLSTLVVCCTEADAQHFGEFGVDVMVVPNGASIPPAFDGATLVDASDSRRIGFMGSSHPPNVEAAKFIIHELAPTFPELMFEFVGSVCEVLDVIHTPNIKMYGIVNDKEKNSILRTWSVALNPIQSGGGSSLKLPDYMAHGLATLNTEIGARGFPVEGWGAGVVTERQNFTAALETILGDEQRLHTLSENAYRWVRTALDWETITKAYRERLRTFEQPGDHTSRKSLLVVTYRYTEPSYGGAEEYLIEVLRHLRPRFSRIDLAAIDVGRLTNAYHFGCELAIGGGATTRVGDLFDRGLYFTPDIIPERQTIAAARDLEQEWTTREEKWLYHRFFPQLSNRNPTYPKLLGGFYAPESHEQVLRRWTSPEFSFLIPPTARVVQIIGWVPIAKTLKLEMSTISKRETEDVKKEYITAISQAINISFLIPTNLGDGPLSLACSTDEHVTDTDHRPFGLLLERMSVLMELPAAEENGALQPLQNREADLSEEASEYLRAEYFELWVNSLVDMAQQRSPTIEEKFAAIRGPHSTALQRWLTQHGADYDTVLVQGVPFDVTPRTVATLSTLASVPHIVILPHFHADDRFYYWRRYLQSFETAGKTLLFSASVGDWIGPRDKFAVVPGGGINPAEVRDSTAVDHFNEVYRSSLPFFLVLGRKTPSKGYLETLVAHATLQQQGSGVNLVLIGPDEDGRVLEQPGVHYLGMQPRSVVRGALSKCLGLITMSTSESFGIVICEAWLFSKPVIANRGCYAFRELIRDGETGLLVQDQKELVAAMVGLAADASACANMGRAGFTEVIQRYTWNQVAGRVGEHLQPPAISVQQSVLDTHREVLPVLPVSSRSKARSQLKPRSRQQRHMKTDPQSHRNR